MNATEVQKPDWPGPYTQLQHWTREELEKYHAHLMHDKFRKSLPRYMEPRLELVQNEIASRVAVDKWNG